MAKLKTSKIASNCATTITKPLVPKPFSFNPTTNILLVPIHVKPNAKESRLESLLSNKTDLVDSLVYAFNMHVAAPPQDGEANVEVIHHTSKV